MYKTKKELDNLTSKLHPYGLKFDSFQEMIEWIRILRTLEFPSDRKAKSKDIKILHTFLTKHMKQAKITQVGKTLYYSNSVSKRTIGKQIGKGGWNVAWILEDGLVLKHFQVTYHKSVGRFFVNAFFENIIHLLLTVIQKEEKLSLVNQMYEIAYDKNTKLNDKFTKFPNPPPIGTSKEMKPYYQKNIFQSRFILSVGEKMDGDCHKYLWDNYSLSKFIKISIQAFTKLQFLQDNFEFIHNDFKLANLFYRRINKRKIEVYISDLGASEMVLGRKRIQGTPDFNCKTRRQQYWRDVFYYFYKFLKEVWKSKELPESKKVKAYDFVFKLLQEKL